MRSPLSFVGLGSNLDDPPAQLRSALAALARQQACELLAISPFYRSAALTPPGDPRPQPDYCNAVVALRSALPPGELLQMLLAIEKAHGRERQADQRWQPRPLDLDLLSCGRQIVQQARLRLPHPELAARRFVLQPWADLAPGFAPPGHAQLAHLLGQLTCPPLQRWGD